MRMILVMAILIAEGVAGAQAQDAKIVVRDSPALTACLDKNVTTAGMVACANAETDRWDKRLNAAYGRIMASPRWSPATKDLLRAAQRAWLGYRAAKCPAQGELEFEGGTAAGTSAAICVTDETALRAVELEAALTTH